MDKRVQSLIDRLAEWDIQLPRGDVRIGGFGDSKALSDSLIGLILAGAKHGTSSLLWSWQFDGEEVPKVGDIEIVLDWSGRPTLIRRATNVEIIPFDCVPPDFAASEGEGDRSLTYWQREHWRFFVEECQRIGRTADVDKSMPIVCERFEVLYKLASVTQNE
ncbi:ASCH domain-containing protein [Paraburkholderia nodosa]|uniref:ASCH domain-containing protein n=1 Tax=Paraburkholderia nodosa TaxID=392320 RepID=UPI00084204D3|nr:ASCH domain-containing protein [Paraburkholderia nodosa]